MQVRIKNDLDGLEYPDCQGLFSYQKSVYSRLAAVFEDSESREKPFQAFQGNLDNL